MSEFKAHAPQRGLLDRLNLRHTPLLVWLSMGFFIAILLICLLCEVIAP